MALRRLQHQPPAPRAGGARAGLRGEAGDEGRRRGGGGWGSGNREAAMVPEAEFTSYYGRPIVKAAPWEHDIPAYLFLGGLAAGSSMLSAGADLTWSSCDSRSAVVR